MSKYLVTIAAIALLAACGQQTGKADTTVSDSTVHQAVQADSNTTNLPVKKTDDRIDPAGIPKELIDSIPSGYSILDTLSGDLNKDSYRDMLVVLKKNGEDSLSEYPDAPAKRPLLIFTGKEDNSFQWQDRNDQVVLCADAGGMMGDPYMGLVIKNGFFSIEHYGGSRTRWTQTITFKYALTDSTWLLHKDVSSSFDVVEEGENDHKATTIRTTKDFGKVLFKDYDVYKN